MRNLLWLVTFLVVTTSVDAQAPLRLTRRYDLDWHHQGIMNLCFTADGKTLVSQGDTVRFWDVATGRATGLLDPIDVERPALHISPDGQSLGLSGWVMVDKKLVPRTSLWKVPAQTREAHPHRLVGYFPDNQPLFADPSGKDITLHFQGKESKLVGHEAKAYAFALHPNGKLLASVSGDKTIKVWDLATQKPIATLPGPDLPSFLRFGFTRDGKKLYLYVSDTHILKVWRSQNDAWQLEGKEIDVGKVGWCLALSPDGAFMISAEASKEGSFVKRWDLPAGTQRWVGKGHVELNGDVSPDGKIVAGNQYGGITLFDAETGKILRTIGSSIPFGTNGVMFDGGRSLLLTALEIQAPGDRHWLRVVELADGKSNLIPWKAYPTRVAGSPDGKSLAVSQSDGSVHLLERDGKVRAAIPSPVSVPKAGDSPYLSFSPDSKILASTGGTGIFLWDAATGAKLATLQQRGFGVGARLNSMVFSHDGKTIAASSAQGLFLWDVAERKLKLDVKFNSKNNAFALAFSRDDKHIATGNRVGEMEIRAVDSGASVQQWKGHHLGVWGLTFTPDNKAVLSCGNDPEVRLWDAATGKAIASYEMRYTQCMSVAFSPDGRTLLTTGSRGAIVWNVEKSK